MNGVSIDNIHDKVLSQLRQKPQTINELWLNLALWHCRYYKTPLKNSTVWQYSFEELFYEFLMVYYWQNPDKIGDDPEEIEKTQREDEGWIKKISKKYGVTPISLQDQEKMLQGMDDSGVPSDPDLEIPNSIHSKMTGMTNNEPQKRGKTSGEAFSVRFDEFE